MTQKQKSKKVNLTPKQRKLIRIVSENLGMAGFTKTMYDMMLEAGYEETSAHQQTRILAGIQEELNPIVEGMKTIRDTILKEVREKKDKISHANLRDLIDAIDKLTRNIQLLSGGKTGSEEVKLSWEK